MVAISTIEALDFVVGLLAAVALVYLLYTETVVVHYPRFVRTVTVGLLAFAVTGPVIGTVAPAYIHAVHGLAGLAVAVALYDLVRGDVEPDATFESLFDPGFASGTGPEPIDVSDDAEPTEATDVAEADPDSPDSR